MIKNTTAVLLALALLFCAVPLASAQTENDGWLIYCADVREDAFTATVVAPAKYTRVSDDPQIETVCAADPDGRIVSAAAAGQIPFYCNGKTETRWTLTVVCALPSGSSPGYGAKLAVLPGSVLDDAGNGNAYVFFDDETAYVRAEGCAEIDVYSSLLQRDYGRGDGTVAAGDVLRVDYSGLLPVEIFVNGSKAASLPGGELQRYTYGVTGTGPLSVVVYQQGEEIAARTLTVITSAEMYERNLRDGLITGEDIPGTDDLIQVGLPAARSSS